MRKFGVRVIADLDPKTIPINCHLRIEISGVKTKMIINLYSRLNATPVIPYLNPDPVHSIAGHEHPGVTAPSQYYLPLKKSLPHTG